jgi:ribosome maturation factor RimP
MIISTLRVDFAVRSFCFGRSAELRIRGEGEELSGPSVEARFVRESGTAAEIAALAEPVLESLGFRLVLVRILGAQGGSPIVEIMAERPDGTMSVEDCKTVSQSLSPLLDVHDPMPGSSYRLQVSSPGIDRPLVRPSDFNQWAGFECKIEMRELVGGRRRFRGTLEGLDDGEVRIEIDLAKEGRQVLGLPLGLIGEARLVLTDDLVRESLRRAKRQDKAVEAESAEPAETARHRRAAKRGS